MMRKGYLFASVGVVCAAVILVPLLADTRKAKETETGKSPTASQLPIGQVVLFSSGVGYFQREGFVEGSQRIDLTFPINDINDLIKSMTLRDLDGGQVNAVSYDSNVPVERTLLSFAINLADNPTFSQLLNQARGEKVEVVLQQTNATQPGTLTGSIVGVEAKQTASGKEVVNVECLNLWCADGLRSLKLSEVQRLRFLNAVMESEFKKALETLSMGHDTQKKTVSIHFDGQGKRNVKVGYVIENPVWKTSYRLVLPNEAKKDDKQKKPYLQGWAVVENQTDEDWGGVKMALISGRPISFQMNLYDALFIKRPIVEPELFASLRPVTYSGGMNIPEGRVSTRRMIEDSTHKQDESIKRLKNVRASAPQQDSNAGDGRGPGAVDQKKLGSDLDLRHGVQSAALGEKLGDYFQYAIDHAVTLPRQKSALLPIVTKDVEGERVSIYNERTHAKFPLLGLVFRNTTGMHLTQGPITVYEGSTYAGDARILDLQKDERRLLSYAIDLGTEVHAIPHSDNGTITSIKIVKGVIWTKHRIKESKTYKIANRSDSERIVMIEHQNRTNFKLTSKDEPWETASDVHRFKVRVPAGKPTEYVVSEEQEFASSVAITNSDDQGISILLKEKVASPAVKKALEQAMTLKGKLSATQREIQQRERELNVITQDQDRLRKNLKEMPPEAVAYKRYLKKFDDQETEIERLQKLIKELHEGEFAQRKEFENFLTNLSVE